MPTGPKRPTPPQEHQAYGLTILHPNHPEVRRLQHDAARPALHGHKVWPTSFVLIDYLHQRGVPPPGMRVGAQMRLGAGGHRLGQNLLRAMLAGWIQRYQQRVARRDLLGELLTSYDHEAAGLEPICQPYRRG